MTTWRELLTKAEASLGSKPDARRLVERASGAEGAEFFLSLDGAVPDRALHFFAGLLARREAGEPLQYVVGRWGFRRLDLYLDHRVLIPRPETEMVVQAALNEARALRDKPVMVDLGTGSGAIALSLALEVPGGEVWAVDRSYDALAVARANLSGLGTLAGRRVRLLEGSWFDALPAGLRGRVDLVVANPPYIADGEVLPAEVAEWEPPGALRAGPTGLEDIETIVTQAPGWLGRPGALVVEIAPHQSGSAIEMADDAGFRDVEVLLDLAGRQRTLVART